MKRLLYGLSLTVLTVGVLIPSVVEAQGRGGRGFRGPGNGGMIGLLQTDEVQQEIELMDDQREALQAIGEEVRDRIREDLQGSFQGLRDLPPEQREQRFDEIRAKVDAIVAESEGRVQKVLLPHQFDRLKQLDLQARIQRGGASALADGQLAETLALTDQQKEQLQERSEQVEQELQEKIRQLRVEARGKLMEVLTPEQRSKLESMLGEEFALPDQPGGGRWFGRGGWRGGRGGPDRGSEQASPSSSPEGGS